MDRCDIRHRVHRVHNPFERTRIGHAVLAGAWLIHGLDHRDFRERSGQARCAPCGQCRRGEKRLRAADAHMWRRLRVLARAWEKHAQGASKCQRRQMPPVARGHPQRCLTFQALQWWQQPPRPSWPWSSAPCELVTTLFRSPRFKAAQCSNEACSREPQTMHFHLWPMFPVRWQKPELDPLDTWVSTSGVTSASKEVIVCQIPLTSETLCAAIKQACVRPRPPWPSWPAPAPSR